MQRFWYLVGLVLFPLGSAAGATLIQDFRIDPLTSFLGTNPDCFGDCPVTDTYPIAGTFRMIVDDSLGYANMRFEAVNIVTPPQPFELFQFPEYFARFEGPTFFYGDADFCSWPFAEGFCISLVGNINVFSGNIDGIGLSMTGIQTNRLSDPLRSPYAYTINAAVVPVPAAVWLFGSGLLGLIGFARKKK